MNFEVTFVGPLRCSLDAALLFTLVFFRSFRFSLVVTSCSPRYQSTAFLPPFFSIFPSTQVSCSREFLRCASIYLEYVCRMTTSAFVAGQLIGRLLVLNAYDANWLPGKHNYMFKTSKSRACQLTPVHMSPRRCGHGYPYTRNSEWVKQSLSHFRPLHDCGRLCQRSYTPKPAKYINTTTRERGRHDPD